MKRILFIVILLFAGLCSYAQSDNTSTPKVQVSYEQSIAKADMAFAGKDYLVAKRFYKIATTAKPAEQYPKTQIDACDKKMNSDSWISTELNCPCNKGKAVPHKGFSDIHDISSDDSLAHAVLPGSVSSVVTDSNNHTVTIIIKHGKYMATYSNLASAFVKQGTDVKESDVIGFTRKQSGSYTLNFSLWFGKEKEDAMKNVHCK